MVNVGHSALQRLLSSHVSLASIVSGPVAGVGGGAQRALAASHLSDRRERCAYISDNSYQCHVPAESMVAAIFENDAQQSGLEALIVTN